MKEVFKLALVLAIFCAVAAAALAVTNAKTSVIIAERERLEKVAEMQNLFPTVADLDDVTVDGQSATIGYDGQGKQVGVMAEGRTEGYGGTIRFNLAIDDEGKIVGLSVVDQSETPGLGDKILGEGFRNQFVGKTAADDFTLGKGVDGISGATVSSRAMAEGVKKTLEQMLARFMGMEGAPSAPSFSLDDVEDGTYTGSGTGLNDGINVEVTVAEGKITDIKILGHNDTPSFFEKAEGQIPALIIGEQKIDVDAVSGATYSSEGIKDAVRNALAQ